MKTNNELATYTNDIVSTNKHISIKTLIIIICSFLLGIVSLKLFENYISKEQSIYSTIDIISLVLTLLVSGASIVLAVAAVQLGKMSEIAIIKRNDESIHLQNQIFMNTTEALIKIQNSTGITEKRIEDIIAGRVTGMSEKIANLAYEKNGYINKDELVKEIESSLLSAINSKTADNHEVENEEKETTQRGNRRELYIEVHNKIMSKIKSTKGVITGKIGHGNPHKQGDDIFDSIFLIGDLRIGVTTYFEDFSPASLLQFTNNSIIEIIDKNIDNVYIFCLYLDRQEAMLKIIDNCKNSIPKSIEDKYKFELVKMSDIDRLINEIQIYQNKKND